MTCRRAYHSASAQQTISSTAHRQLVSQVSSSKSRAARCDEESPIKPHSRPHFYTRTTITANKTNGAYNNANIKWKEGTYTFLGSLWPTKILPIWVNLIMRAT